MHEEAPRPRLAIVSPVFNDWECIAPLLSGLTPLCQKAEVHILLVDDGSSLAPNPEPLRVAGDFASIHVLELGCNLGHQRAIAIGLVHAIATMASDKILVLDSDGEDRPEDAQELWEASQRAPGQIVVAQRRSRSEDIRFRIFYRLYKVLFRVLTGQTLDFGNFVLLPTAAAARLSFMLELWNHFPSAVMRSRVSVLKIPMDRQARFSGTSRMNFTALVNHGLAAISAFNDAVFVRLLIFTSLLAGVSGFAAILGLLSSEASQQSEGSGLSTLLVVAFFGFLQAVVLLGVVTFLALSSRSTTSSPPRVVALEYVKGVSRIC